MARIAINPRMATVLLALSMFFTGAAGFIFECILSTVASYILGNSIEQFSVTMSLMMLMMGVAGWWQKNLSDDHLIEKFLAVETALALLGGFAPIAVYAAYATMETHFALVQYFFVTAIGFLIGLEIPLVLRINRRFVPALKSNVATVFSTDYVGAFAGALVWAFILLRYYPLTETSFMAAGLNFLVAIFTYAYFTLAGAVSHRGLSLAVVATAAVALSLGYNYNRDWSRLLEQRFYDRPIVVSKTTRYQHIVMTASVDPLDYRLYVNGNLQLSSQDERIYHEMLVHPAMALAGDPRRVLILGGGDGLALREVLKHRSVEEAALVDIDPDMIELARSHAVLSELNEGALLDARVTASPLEAVEPEALEAPVHEYSHRKADGGEGVEEAARVTVYTVDADRVADQLPGGQDVVIIDLPDPNSIELAKLYSVELYLKLRRRLSPGALVVVQSTSPYHARATFVCIQETLRAAGFETLPYHDNVPSFGDWGWILAWEAEGGPAADVAQRARELTDFGIPPEELSYLTPEVFHSSLTFGKGALDAGGIEPNRLMQPTLIRYYLTESWRR